MALVTFRRIIVLLLFFCSLFSSYFKTHGECAVVPFFPLFIGGLDHREKQEREDKSSEGDSNNCRGDGDGIDEGSEGRVVKLVDDDETRENVDDDETKENADDEPEIIAESFAEVEKVKESELVNSQCSGMTTEDRRGVKSGQDVEPCQDVEPSSRKRIRLDGECDGLVTSTSKKVHTSIADTTSLTKVGFSFFTGYVFELVSHECELGSIKRLDFFRISVSDLVLIS